MGEDHHIGLIQHEKNFDFKSERNGEPFEGLGQRSGMICCDDD